MVFKHEDLNKFQVLHHTTTLKMATTENKHACIVDIVQHLSTVYQCFPGVPPNPSNPFATPKASHK